jgi:Tol biopolymer transport system component
MRYAKVLIGAVCLASVAVVASGSGGHDGADRNGRIVFQRIDPEAGKIRLYTAGPDGRDEKAITLPGPSEDKDSIPDWSPDGRLIAFRRFFHLGEPGETSDVLVVRPDGSGVRNLTRAGCTGDCLGSETPAWSPDGRQIAFERAIGPLPADGPPPIAGIFVMDADGSNVRQLTQFRRNAGTEDHGATWSPDGRRIAFMRANNTNEPANASAIYTVSARGGDLRLVRRMPLEWPAAGNPDWSPDGGRLLFTTYCYFGQCGGSQPSTGAQLFTVRPNGEGLRQLTHVPGNASDARWSPDGRKIVFARNERLGPTGDVYTMNADGSNVRRVTNTPELDTHKPDWGPRR